MANVVDITVRATDEASGIIGGIGKALGGVGAIAAGVLAGGLVVAGKALSDFVSAAMDAELVQAKFNAQVDNSPLAPFKSQLEGLAQSLSTVTRFEDENILAAEGLLATYQTIGMETMPAVLNSTLDLAEYMGTDAVGAAEALGRALSDISGGSLSLLTRQRLLTKEQEAMAKKIYETNGAAAAQEYVVGILDQKIGGLAETMGNTTQGQFTIFENALGNIKETLGAALIPALAKLAQVLSEKLADPAVQQWITQFANTLAEIGVSGVAAIENLSKALDQAFGFIQKLANGMNLRTALLTSFDYEAVKPFLNALDGMKPIFDGLKTVIDGLTPAIQSFVGEALQTITNWYVENGPLIQEYAGLMMNAWQNNIAPALVAAWGIIEPILTGLLNIILQIGTLIMQVATGDWQGAWNSMIAILQFAGTAIWEALIGLFETIAALFGGSLEQIKITWSSNWQQLVQIVTTVFGMAVSAVSGVFNNIKTAVTTGWNAIRQLFQTLINQVIEEIRKRNGDFYQRALGWLIQMKTALINGVGIVIQAIQTIIAQVQAAVEAVVIPIVWSYPGRPTMPTGGGGTTSGGGSCFLDGSLVLMGDDKLKPIEEIEVGDSVKTRDMETGEIITTIVCEKFTHAPEEMDGYYTINDIIRATGNHLLLVRRQELEWVRVDELQIGDLLVGVCKDVPVKTLEFSSERRITYNLHVDHPSHNYYVEGVVVHNSKTGGYASGTGGWLTVPPGYPNDSYPIRLTSGEQFAVVPQGGSMPASNVTINVGSVRSDEDIREIARLVAMQFS